MSIPIVFTDGGCSGNPGPMGIGVVITIDGNVIEEFQERPREKGTNNIAEYMAIILALEESVKKKYKEIMLKSDSMLAVSQLSKGWRVKEPHIKTLFDKVRKLENEIKVTYEHIPREKNLADRFANMGV